MLVHVSVGTVLGATSESGSRAVSSREEEEYQKICERNEQLDDQWLTSEMVNQPPEVRGPVKGTQVWVKLPNQEVLALEIKSSTFLYDVLVEASKLSKSVTPTSDVYITCGKES